jgi:hypothetical protein
MNRQIIGFLLLLSFGIISPLYSQGIKKATQSKKVKDLFASQEILPIHMSYSIKELKKNTNDSTFIKSSLKFQDGDSWDSD